MTAEITRRHRLLAESALHGTDLRKDRHVPANVIAARFAQALADIEAAALEGGHAAEFDRGYWKAIADAKMFACMSDKLWVSLEALQDWRRVIETLNEAAKSDG
jgi:hypothetical protein